MKRRIYKDGLFQDLAIIAFSVVIAIILLRTDVIIGILRGSQELEFLGSFIAGIFFTSVFTTAPATVTLAEIAQYYSPWLTAIAGGAGAVVGDLIIFHFVKERFSDHLMELVSTQNGAKRVRKLFKRRGFRWMTFVVAGLIIASPFPDELGVALLGFSKMKISGFIAVSFVGNSVGILLIGFAARALM